jgi:hypothetical protein
VAHAWRLKRSFSCCAIHRSFGCAQRERLCAMKPRGRSKEATDQSRWSKGRFPRASLRVWRDAVEGNRAKAAEQYLDGDVADLK